MKKLAYFFMIGLMFSIIFTSVALSDSGEDNAEILTKKSNIAIEELGKFKEIISTIIPNIEDINDMGISSKEMDILIKEIFNEENFDKPINIDNWANLIKIIVKLPKDEREELIEMYVYGLADGNQIHREDAIGGLVKLLSSDYLRIDFDANEFKKFKLSLKDANDISDKHVSLIFDAYKGKILDKTVDNMFRPKELLTNAEAVSTLYRTAVKLTMNTDDKENWVLGEINSFEKTQEKKLETIKYIKALMDEEGFNNPINIKDWYRIMEDLLSIKNSENKKKIKDYTFNLSDGKYITRENAVIGIMKLVPEDPRDATKEELSKTENYFKDFEDINDTSKVSQALAQGLIKGYEDKTFRPQENMTYEEAAVLIIRAMEKDDLN